MKAIFLRSLEPVYVNVTSTDIKHKIIYEFHMMFNKQKRK
jgi:hypothetical protein